MILICALLYSPKKYDSYFKEIWHFKTHEWVRQFLDISSTWEDIRRGFHKNPKEAERKIRKYGFTFRITTDLSDFDRFYHDMFVPHIQNQHGPHAYIDPYDEMKPFFRKGFYWKSLRKATPYQVGCVLWMMRCLFLGE